MNLPLRTVYLAGPMSGLSMVQARAWRADFAEMMPAHIICSSPVREVQFLGGDHTFEHHPDKHPDDSARVRPDGMLIQDLNDVRTADAVVCNFLTSVNVSIGSVGECFVAKENNVPVILVTSKLNVHFHFMLNGCGVLTYSLEEAAEYTISLLTPGL